MPATSLRCRSCATEYALEDIGTCTACFAPLDPVYDWDELARTVSRESIAAGPASIWRYAPLLPAEAPAEPRLAPGARPRAASRGGGRRRRALAEARHRQSHALLQGPRRCRRGREGEGAGPREDCLLLDRKPRQRGRRAGRSRGDPGGRLLSGRPRAREARRHRRLRCHHLCRQWNLRRLQPAHDRAFFRAPLGVRQREPALVLRRGIEDRRVRDRGAARLGRA
jgi:hypothetical protein